MDKDKALDELIAVAWEFFRITPDDYLPRDHPRQVERADKYEAAQDAALKAGLSKREINKVDRKLIKWGETEVNTLPRGAKVLATKDFGGILRRRIPAGTVGVVVQPGLGRNMRVSFTLHATHEKDEQVEVTVHPIDPIATALPV